MKKIIIIFFAIITCFCYSQNNKIINYKYGFINEEGKEITPIKYDEANSFNFGIAAVRINDYWGGINSSGNEIIPFKYEKIEYTNKINDSILIPVKFNDKWGFVNKEGEEVIALKYDEIDVLYYGLEKFVIAIRMSDKWGIINEIGDIIIPVNFEEISKPRLRDIEADEAYNQYLAVKIKEKWGLIDFKGNIILTPKYDGINQIGNSLYAVKINNKWIVVNQNNKKIISKKFDDIREVQKDDSLSQNIKFWAFHKKTVIYYDAAFNIVSKNKIKYNFGYSCHLEYSECERNEKYGCIKKFYNGMAAVKKAPEKWLVLNQNSVAISEAIYDEVKEPTLSFCAYLKIKIQNKWGIIFNDGKIISHKYDEINDFENGFSVVKMIVD